MQKITVANHMVDLIKSTKYYIARCDWTNGIIYY